MSVCIEMYGVLLRDGNIVMSRICVIGSNSGRNAGDAAILSSIIKNIHKLKPDTKFEVPVPRKSDLYNRYSPDTAKAIPMMPWNLSARLLGLPTIMSIVRSDVMLITDGIIFDVKLLNPMFNFLLYLIFLVPLARLFRTKVVGLLIGVGPLDSWLGRRWARAVCNMSDDVFVREDYSAELLKEVGVDPSNITIYADAALVDVPADDERVDEIIKENSLFPKDKIVGINVNMYLDQWLNDSEGVDSNGFIAELALAMDRIIDETEHKVVMVLTQIMDVQFAHKVLESSKHQKEIAVMGNDRYSAEELMGVMGRMRYFSGMRVHSLILASAMKTPCIGLAYAPKVRHFMDLMKTPDSIIELNSFTADELVGHVKQMIKEDSKIRPAYETRVDELKERAAEGYRVFCDKYLD